MKRITPNRNDEEKTHLTPVFDENSILFQSDEFIVINKPFDVRMDGNFGTTVEKLLESYFSLNCQPRPTFKWVHQLDFATSGVLW